MRERDRWRCGRAATASHRENGWDSWVDLTVIYPNRGFTGGNNAVIRPALESDDPPEYVLLLNADTIVKEHALDTLVAFMDDHPKVGIAGSMLLSPDGAIQASPFRFPGIATELDRGLRLGIVSKLLSPWAIVLPKPKEACRVDWAAGASMILRRTMLEQIGLLDEGLYTYFDDTDICLRARRAGWETWYVPESQVIHLEGASTGIASHLAKPRPSTRPIGTRRGTGIFMKNYGALYTALVDAAFITGYAIWRLQATAPAQAGHRPAAHADRLDPPQRLLRGAQGQVVENPADYAKYGCSRESHPWHLRR